MTLADAIATLKRDGLLERASYIKVGDVEVTLGPPMVPVEAAQNRETTVDDERRAVQEVLYAASHGHIPGVE